MTIATTSNKAQWSGNGSTTVFPFCFEIGNANQASLYLTSGGSTILVPTSTYEIAGLGSPNGGTITYPLSGSPLASGTRLTLIRTVPLQQLVDLINQSNYFPDAVEGALDYLMMALQQVAQAVAYALQTPQSDPTLNLTFPSAAARANTLAGFDPSGNAITFPITASVGAGNMTAELGGNGHPGFKNGTDFIGGTTTTLTLSQAYGSVANVLVAWDATYVEKDAYQIIGNEITFGSWIGNVFVPSAIPSYVSNVDVIGGTTLSMYVPPNGSVGPAQLQPNSVGDTQLAWGSVLGRVVDSNAQLAALNPAIYQRAFGTGYRAPGDGGGGSFIYSGSTSQTLANGITIIASTVASGCWLLNHNGWITAEQCGAYNDGTNSAANNTTFANIVTFLNAQSLKPEIRFSGTYAYSESPNWAIQNAIYRGCGEAHFQYSGTDNAVIMDGTGLPNDGAYDITWEDITVDAPTTALDGYFIKNVHHSRVVKPKVRGAGAASSGIEVNGCVCTLFVNPEVSPNADNSWYLNARPLFGMTFSGAVGKQASYNTIINPVMEGLVSTNGIGINLIGSLGNQFFGGTSEGCNIAIATGTLANGCSHNKFHGIDLEANTIDIYEQGGYTEYHGVDSSSMVEVISGAVNALFVGGSYYSIQVATGALNCGFNNVGYNRADYPGTGTFQVGDTSTRVRDCFDAKTGLAGPFPQTSIAVGASPFTYTNSTGREQTLLLSSMSGVSQLEFIRSSTGTLLSTSPQSITLSPGDELQITWATSAPSVWELTR